MKNFQYYLRQNALAVRLYIALTILSLLVKEAV